MNNDLKELQAKLGYEFKDIKLLERALTHSSASHEDNNERLEFLGDSVLQFVVTYKVYLDGGNEGEMTYRRQKLVSHPPLMRVSQSLGLPDHIKYTGTLGSKALSSVYEAVVGAIYCDGGISAAEDFIKRTLIASHSKAPENYKGMLQEYMQAKGVTLPSYKTVQCGGQPHSPVFSCEVTVDGKTFSSSGASKAKAEQSAAKQALEHLNKSN